MHVTVVAPLVTPLRDRQLGGSQAVVCDLARGLAAAGEDVELVAARGSAVSDVPLRSLPEGPHPEALLALDRPLLRRIVPGPWPAETAATYLHLAVDLARRRPDVVHTHGQEWPALYAIAASGRPQVHTFHLPPLDPSLVAGAVAAAGCRPRPRFVVPSRATAAAWRRFVPVDAVVGNGVDPASVPFSDRPEPDLAIVPGRISPEKGTHVAIDAIARSGLRALVVGPVYDRAYHAAEIRPRLRRGRGRWLGGVARDRLAVLLGRAVVAVLAPLWEEPFGLVAVEANLAGTPVAGFARGGLPEVVGQRGGVLVRGRSAENLARAISAATNLPRASVREDAMRRHDLAAMVDRYRRVYRAALGED